MNLANKLYWTLVSILAGSTIYFAANYFTTNIANGHFNEKPTAALEQKVQETSKEEKVLTQENKKLKVFKGYEQERYQQYDALIAKYTDFWNKEFSNIPGFTPLEPNLVKAMALVESGSSRDIEAWNHDPMQIANQGDHALKVLRDGLENFIPKGGYQNLHGITETNMKNGKWDYSNSKITPELSIKYGIRWLFHKAFIFNNDGKPVGMRSWNEAIKRYNGGGDPHYNEKIKTLYEK